MVLATLGALGGQYAMGKIEANSANSAAKKAQLSSLWYTNWLAEQNYKRQVNFAKHAHQYEMEDLKNAGLNPALTAMGGQGATAGGGGGIGSMVPRTSKGVELGKLLDYTNSAKQNSQRDRELEQQLQQIQSNINKQDAETLNIIKQGKWIDPKNWQEIKESESRILNNTTQSAKNTAEVSRLQEETTNLQEGIFSKLAGTKGANSRTGEALGGALLGITGLGALGGVYKGYKMYKYINNAKQVLKLSDLGKKVSNLSKLKMLFR